MAHTSDTFAQFPTTSTSTSTANPVAVNYTCGAGTTVLVVMIAYMGSADRTGGAPTYDGVALTQADIVRRAPTGPESSVELWYMLDPPTGSALSVSVPNTGALATKLYIASGISATGASALDVAGGDGSSGINPSVSIDTTADGDFICGVVTDGSNAWGGTPNGNEIGTADFGSWGGGAQYHLQTSAGTQAVSWSSGANEDWGIVVAAFKEVTTSTPLTLTLSDDSNILSDGEVKILGMLAAQEDSLQAVTEELAQLMSYELALADSEAANWADAHNLLLSQFLALADSNAPIDAAEWNLGLREDFTDNLTLSDDIEQHIGTALPLGDDVNVLNDSAEFLLAYHLTLDDSNQAAFPSTSILDDFNRADEGPPPSADWLKGFGLFLIPGELTAHKVVSNEMAFDFGLDGNGSESYWDAQQFGPDCECYISITTGGWTNVSLGLRLNESVSGRWNGYFLYYNPGSYIAIFRAEDGVATELIDFTTSILYDKVGVRAVGQTISIWGSTLGAWGQLLETTDSTHSGAGYLAVFSLGVSNARLDDFSGGVVAGGLFDAFAQELGTGPSLTLDLSDAVVVSDSLTLGHGLLLADGAAELTDALSLNADELLTLTDTVSLADLLNDSIALQSGHEIALAGTLVLSDTHALELSHLLTFTDSIVLTDSYEQDLVSTVAEITEDLADDINVLADSLAIGLGLVFNDNADNLTDAETTTLGYSLDFTDTINLSDTISLELQHLLTIDDSFSLTDAQSSILDYGVSFSDSIDNLTDAVDIQSGQLLGLSDSVDNLADSHTETIAHLLDFSDALALTDSVLLGYGLSVSEDINLLIDAIETSAPQGPLREVGLTDAIVLSDAVALELRYLLEVADDAATLNDSLALIEGLLTSFSDSISLTDAVAATLDHLRPLADSFALSDAAQIHLGYSLDLSDSVALDDSISLRLGYELATSDSVTLSDVIDLAEGYLIAFSDSLSLIDAEVVRLDYLTAFADSLVLSDAIQLQLGHELSVSDTVVLSDGIAEGLSHHLELTDNAALLADSEAETLGLALILAENGPVFTDSVEFFSAWLLGLSDTLILTDSLMKSGEGFLPLSDSLLLSDDVAVELRGPDLEEALSDSLTFGDAISLALGNELQVQLVLSDVVVISDHYFDLRLPYTPNLKRNSVVPSRARTTTISGERLTIVPPRNRTTTIE